MRSLVVNDYVYILPVLYKMVCFDEIFGMMNFGRPLKRLQCYVVSDKSDLLNGSNSLSLTQERLPDISGEEYDYRIVWSSGIPQISFCNTRMSDKVYVQDFA